MSSESRLSPKERRSVLQQLSRDRLTELTEGLDLDVDDRRSTDSHIDAIVRKRSLDFRRVLELLKREELQAACDALGLDSSGREKAKLVGRILADVEPVEAPSSPSSRPPPMSVGVSGALKSALRRFVLDVAGGYRGRDASTHFTSQLLRCFGWPDGQVPEASMPASLAIVADGDRTTRDVALIWKERRVLIDVVKHDVMLDLAWKDLLRVCLQVDPVPQYVVLTNQRDLALYDLARDRDTPRLSIPLDDIPKYSEAFPFLSTKWVPGTTPKIINVSKVSGEVAELVARLYRSLKEQHPTREREVVQFTLQCILTMFAEDIGLLPQEYFTTLLYEGARGRDVERRLRELFRLMSTRDVPEPRAVPFFNGGLFTDPVTLPLGDAQLAALTKASEANWKYVDPHIFGSVFQGVMNDAERHKSGAHYTAHEDIMRVVGPTIVDPWRQRIREARTLAELLEVRAALLKFRVLDPACGSGNFLYIAFRELYRLDTELLARIREFPSTHGEGKAKVTWGVGIQTSSFFGIDINPFAVELAKVTLNIAKKIAFDERRELAADLVGQMELDVDPSLPLDNLDNNIVCTDALFAEWPAVDAVVGNPPFLDARKLAMEHGRVYAKRVRDAFPLVPGRADLCVYWFRKAHDHLNEGGRAGLVGTNTIRQNNSREGGLAYIVANGGTITHAVASQVWSGDAAVHVSIVNWIKGSYEGLRILLEQLGDRRQSPWRKEELRHIPSSLSSNTDVSTAKDLAAVVEPKRCFEGQQPGHMGFRLSLQEYKALLAREPTAINVTFHYTNGTDLLSGKYITDPEFVIDFGAMDRLQASQFPLTLELVEQRVLTKWTANAERERAETGEDRGEHQNRLRTWWRLKRRRADMLEAIGKSRRYIACARVTKRPIFVFVGSNIHPDSALTVFAFDDDYSFGILQAATHSQWFHARCSSLKRDWRYTNETVFDSFPWPQEPSESEVVSVATAGRTLRQVRDVLMKDNGWSLRALYQAAEVPGPHPLTDAQAALDDAVRHAYGIPADQEATEFLLELNQLVAEDEAEGRRVQGPGVPHGLDPRDPRWTSDDCIGPSGL